MSTSIVEQVLADPDNNLEEMVRAFAASGEPCWHIDRHVFGVLDARPVSTDRRRTACAVALALTRKWIEQWNTLASSGLLLSRPVVIVDDDWIAGVPRASPPHVYFCISRNEMSFEPVQRGVTTERASSGNSILDSLLSGHVRLLRLEGAFEGEPGAWILELLEGPARREALKRS